MGMNIRQRKVLRAVDVMGRRHPPPCWERPQSPGFFKSDLHVSLYLELMGSPWPRANCPENWAPGYGDRLDHVQKSAMLL